MYLSLTLLGLTGIFGLSACTDDAKDSDTTTDTTTDSETTETGLTDTGLTDTGTIDPCSGSGEPGVTIGYPLLGSFDVMSAMDQVGLEVAPQGGFGVSISGQTTGLPSLEDGVFVDVLLETYLDGELDASFLSEDNGLYCQGDGTSLFWGVVVGFDSEKYTTTNLGDLDGAIVDLRVVVTDEAKNQVETTLTVEIVVN